MPPARTPVVARINFTDAADRRGYGAAVTRFNQLMRAIRREAAIRRDSPRGRDSVRRVGHPGSGPQAIRGSSGKGLVATL